MKKFVLKLDLHDDQDKRKALKTVSALGGIDSISIDMKGKQLTMIGTVDPIIVVSKLRKFWLTDIILVGPAKEPEKKEEANKEEPKKDEGKKQEEPKQEGEAKQEGPQKEEEKKEPEPVLGFMAHRSYYPLVNTYYYGDPIVEDKPNGCVIC